jgi:hypothetical protein
MSPDTSAPRASEELSWSAPSRCEQNANCYGLDDGSSANCAIPGAELSLAQVTGR